MIQFNPLLGISGFILFSKGINPKINKKARLEFELTYSSTQDTTSSDSPTHEFETPNIESWNMDIIPHVHPTV